MARLSPCIDADRPRGGSSRVPHGWRGRHADQTASMDRGKDPGQALRADGSSPGHIEHEAERRDEAELEGNDYTPIVVTACSWKTRAAPKGPDGKLDHNAALTGTDLIDFVGGKLFPYLKRFREPSDNPDSLDYKIGEIFSKIVNKFRSGYALRDAVEIVDQLDFDLPRAGEEVARLRPRRHEHDPARDRGAAASGTPTRSPRT